MIFRRTIGVGIFLIWLGALVPELLPALLLPTPPHPIATPGVFMFWLINYLLAAMIFTVMPTVGAWILVVEPIEPPEMLR